MMKDIFKDAQFDTAPHNKEIGLVTFEYGDDYRPKRTIELPIEVASELIDLRYDRDYWRAVAIYLADCHAANIDEALLSRTSKWTRQRFAEIMKKASRYLRKAERAPGYSYDIETRVIERLNVNAQQIATSMEKSK